MEDRSFELMTKMYSEFTKRFDNLEGDIKDIKTDVAGLKTDVTGLKTDVQGLKNDVIVYENKIDKNSKALFDGYKQTYEKLEVIESKLEKQDVEIRVIKGAK
jgi:predicted  nucleic acid-binding Zn-ribbon protein